jgi:hypothetical protein
MFSDSIFGLVVFVSAYIISRIISEGALRKLSVEQKAMLLDAFSSYRIYSLIAVFLIVVTYLLSTYFFWQYDNFLTPFFFGLILLVLAFNSVYAYGKLRALEIPRSYINSFWLSSALQFIGVIFLFAPTLAKYFG